METDTNGPEREALMRQNAQLRSALRNARHALLNLRQEGESRYVPIIRQANEALGDFADEGLFRS